MIATYGQKIRTGIFTIIGLCLLIGAIFLIGKTKNMFGNTFHIYGTFKNVGGLQVGDNVRFVGINVGTVENVRIISDTLARVDMIINEKAHPFLKTGAVATIGTDGLMGDKLVSIAVTTETEDSAIMKNGGQIATTSPADMDKIISHVERIATNAEVITEGLAGITTQINSGKGSIGKLLYNDNIARNLDSSANNMKSGTEGFNENMKAVKHSFLLKGYFKRKERRQQRKQEQQQQRSENTDNDK